MALYDEWHPSYEDLSNDFEFFEQCQRNDVLNKKLKPLYDRLKQLHELHVPIMVIDDKGVYSFKPIGKNFEYLLLEKQIQDLLNSYPYVVNTKR